jgi:putative cell wall-binding protein
MDDRPGPRRLADAAGGRLQVHPRVSTRRRLTTRPIRFVGPFLVALVVLLTAPFARVATASESNLTRVAGVDRYSTAVAISSTFAPGVSAAYIAVGTDFPDALSGAAAAGVNRDPVLLVTTNSIPASVGAELTRLVPARIVILGGPGAVSGGVEAALDGYTTGPVQRLAGPDRYATSAAISAATFTPGVPVAYVAVGSNFPDALAGAAAAGHVGAPVLLVRTDAIPAPIAAELARLAPGRIVVLGGPSVVSGAVESALHGYTAGTVTRLAGADRYSTAVAVSQATYTQADTIYLATGLNFPDALAGASLGGPILMTAPNTLPAAVRDEIVRLGASRVVVLGGVSVVSDAVAAAAAGGTSTTPTGHWSSNLYDARAVRWQQPSPYACTAANVMMMLNMVAHQGPSKGDGFSWTPSISYELQTEILAFERLNMTMVTAGTNGTDPHGWRNALNAYGWGSLTADVYRDLAFGSFDEAVKAAIVSVARFGKPAGLLMLDGRHAAILHGWDVSGDDPATGSTNFTVNGVWLTDPWEPNGHQNAFVWLSWLQSGPTAVRFTPYLETDSPYRDPIDGQVGIEEWLGRYVILAAVR